MTVLGKILAILNLVLSLAVGAFLVMTYVARTNWHAAYVNMQKQAQVAQADADAFKKEMEKVKGDKAKGEEQLADYRKRTDEEKLALNARIEALGNKLKDAGQEIAKHVAAQSAAGDELKRRASEVDYLKTLVTARDVEIKNREKQVEEMRAAMVEATLNYNGERERNERLLQENERLTKDIRQFQQAASSTSLRSDAPRTNPPAEDIEGRVTATDPQSGYITVSVGSDAGVNKGNTLEVYRLKPDPSYLGTIQILNARPKEAVGKLIDRPRGLIQAGDQVSSSIVRRRY